MKRILYVTLLCLLGMETGFAATAAKGVFSVSGTKIVQFANANSVYSENELIQWSHVSDVIESGWDVLTGEEWSYLLASGRTNANNLNALGTVNGKKGLIILPDSWSQPDGVPAYRTVDETGVGYEYNVYTAEQWAVMADAGAVFLPCAGYGYEAGGGTPAEDTEDHGAYWAKNQYSTDNAFCIHFNDDAIHDNNNAVKTNYYSVILVRDVTVTELDEEDEADDYNTHWSAAKGKYFAYVNRTLVKDGTLYTLCLPFDVPDIDDSPLAGADVYTFEGGSVTGSRGNEILHLNLSRLTGKRLTQGVPYLLKWENTGVTLSKPLYFENVENWDTDTETATDPGNETVKFHGVYPKAHIEGYTSGSVAHYNFFLGANNTLYWPDDTGDDGAWATHKMKGFRAYFYITPGGGPSSAPAPRNMPVVWHINSALGATTDIDNGEWLKVNGECTKVIRNGQIYLMYKGTMYDVQGRRIEN